jgi:hypothetical protein
MVSVILCADAADEKIRTIGRKMYAVTAREDLCIEGWLL